MQHIARAIACATLSGLYAYVPVAAQSTILTVVGSDSVPIPYAWVAVQGGIANITDEHGKLSLGGGRRMTLSVEVRRIGYAPWSGKVAIADTATKMTIVLPVLARTLGAVTVTAASQNHDAALAGFYDRWLMRQKGALSATFIGPEEIEKRHVSRPSDLLEGVNGVRLLRTDRGSVIARGNGGTCFMTVMLDGRPLCPPTGCHVDDNANAPQLSRQPAGQAKSLDDVTVNLNQYINADDVVAIEVYARGANMPISLQAPDNACGVIAIWTGSRN